MAKLQPKVYIIGLTNGAACSQSAPQQCLEALLRSGAARPVLHHRRSALQRPSGAHMPAADGVAACTSASATRSTSQLAGWPALLQPPCRPSHAKRWFRRQTLCGSLISGWRATDRSLRNISEPQPAYNSLSGAPGRPRPVVAAPPGWSQQDGRRCRCP